MHPDCVFIVVNHQRMSLADFAKMRREEIEYVDARGCTALTALDAGNAEYVDARGCTALTALDAGKARTVDARGCTALTALDAGNATVDCTSDYLFGGVDSRGYVFEALVVNGEWRVMAGCRNFTIAEALHHWGPTGPSNRPNCLSFVRKFADAIAKAEGRP